MELRLGDRGRLTLLRVIGRGGMGVVYAAYDRDRETEVALKTIANISPNALFRFKREFRALADVSHRNLVTLHELSSVDGQWFFTMELLTGVSIIAYVRGATVAPAVVNAIAPRHSAAGNSSNLSGSGNLRSPATPLVSQLLNSLDEEEFDTVDATGLTGAHVHRPQDLSHAKPSGDPRKIRNAFLQLTAGVSALHASGHLHRDIKPSNIMVSPEDRVVLLDFGVITELGQRKSRTAESLAGTPAYMAPEQLNRAQPGTEASDWFSVGVILYEALAGCRPYFGEPNRETNLIPDDPRTAHPEAPADLCELSSALLAAEPSARPTAEEITEVLRAGNVPRVQVSTPQVRATDRSFIGRSAELTVLRDALAEARAGNGNALYVSGRSGLGKSLLIRHFLDEVRADPNAVILEGRCYLRESVPYKALDSVVDALSGYLMGLPNDEAERYVAADSHMLARVFPVVDRVGALRRSGARGVITPDPHEVKRRAFGALRDMLYQLSTHHTVVIFIDDLQWGDADSAPIIEGLLRPPNQPALLLLASFRSEERDRSALLRSLFRTSGRVGTRMAYRELPVDVFTELEAIRLARSLAGDDADSIDVERLARDAGGHPYFIHELIDQARRDPEVARASVSLDELIARRVAVLPDNARRALEVIAVAGLPMAIEVLRQAARLEASNQRDIVHQLQAARFVHASGTRATDLVEPFHDRIRETVVATLSDDALSAHHRSLASALACTGADAETLAAHYRAAGDEESAAEYSIRAGDQAAAALAFEQAANLYKFAIDVHTSILGSDTRDLQLKLADALANAGRGYDAAEAYLVALPGSTVAEAIELQRVAALEYLRAGHIDSGVEVIARVLASMGLRLPASSRRSFLWMLWHRAVLRVRGLGFRPRDASQVSAEEMSRIDTCWSVALGLAMVDTYRCADFQTRNVLFALRAGEPSRIARALSLEIGFASLEGTKQRPRALRIIGEARRLAEQVGDPKQQAWVEGAAALSDFQVGLYRETVEHVDTAVAIWRNHCTGVSWEVSSAELYRVWALFYLGELKQMLQRVESLLEEAHTRGDLYTAANLCSGVPNLAWLVAGRVDDAERLLAEALSKWSRDGFHLQHYWGGLASAHHELRRGDYAAAYDRMNTLTHELKRSMMLRIQTVRAETLHLRARAAIATAGADPTRSDCLRQAERDARRLAKDRTPLATTFSLLIRAGIASVRNHDSAVELHDQAEQAARQADLGLFATAAQRRRGQLLGGDEGARLVAAADDWLTNQGVADLEETIAVFVPG